MTGFAELCARVAPDYARMLGRLAGAMLPDVVQEVDPEVMPLAGSAAQAVGKDGAMIRADDGALPDAGRQAASAMPAAAPLRSVDDHGARRVEGNGVGTLARSRQAAASALALPTKRAVTRPKALYSQPSPIVKSDNNAAHKSAAFPAEPLGARLRLRVRSGVRTLAEREPIAPQRVATVLAAGLTTLRDIVSEPGILPLGDSTPGRAFRIHRPVADVVQRASAQAGPGVASSGAGAAELPAMAWGAPDLIAPRGWPATPSPGADPFADAALEDALGELLERTALTSGIDL